jgi:hypothetical protein
MIQQAGHAPNLIWQGVFIVAFRKRVLSNTLDWSRTNS